MNFKLSILLVVLSFSFNLYALENTYCQLSSNKHDSSKVKKDIEKEINAFSNLPEISKKADETLSKLITAKSPFIFSWVKVRNLNPEKDTLAIATKWREYFALNFVINKYPLEEKSINKEIEKVFEKLRKKFFTEKTKKELENNFAEAKKLSIQTIESYSLEAEAKKQIIETLNSIQLYFPDKLQDSKFITSPMEFFDWGVAYDPISKEINLGLNAFNYASGSTMISVFAHELAHSFDSCRWGSFYKGEWPFQKVSVCLRQWAKPRDDVRMDEMVKNNRLTKELANSLKDNPTCNKSSYPPIGIQADQLPETFADWFSAEATASVAAAGYRSDLCEEKTLNPGSSYLTNYERLEKIYFSNPLIRSRLKMKHESPSYCSFEK